uniref:Alfy-like armadillo-like repeat domain-containing protein n=1 Tax=Kryptolebias marmoratus TaxID=37003 RepID=A0A3Q3BBW3_KRYMA
VSGSLLAEVAVAVFSFVRDTYHLSPALFDEFDTNNDQKNGVSKILTQQRKCLENTHLTAKQQEVGLTVKNLPAFHLLQASLLRSQDCLLCCQLIETLQKIWEKDPANFFLLEWSVQSMAQLAGCMWCKPSPVHKLYFSMLEMVIFRLNYIPHETLRALLVVLKQSLAGTLADGVGGIEFSVVALQFFYNDCRLQELLLGELRRRAKILRKAGVALPCAEDSERLLTTCMLQVVSTFTLRSIKNTVLVRDLGMIPYIKIFLDDDQFRGPTLCILEQLAEINPDEFMSTAIGALCSSTQQELCLKRDLLQSVLRVLESPNSWEAFRKAGGFTGLLSLVVDMEGALSEPPTREVWKTLGHQQLLELLLLALHILALAVHLHDVNAHHFQAGGFYERLADALLQLGCFHTEALESEKWDEGKCSCPRTAEDNQASRKSFFQFVELAEATCCSTSPQPNLPVTLRTCIRLLSYLDHFASGTYSPRGLQPRQEPDNEYDEDKEKLHEPTGYEGVNAEQPLVLRFSFDQIIFHPGAIRVIMTLLPHLFSPEDPQLSMEVQFSVVYHIQAMVKSERNRQIMCEGGLISTLLVRCRSMLLAPNHPLHLPVTRILEKLSSQAISHSDFRKFLCLGDPLLCLEDKTTKQVQPELDPEARTSNSDGTYLFYESTKTDAESSRGTLKRTFSLLQPTTSFGSPIPVHQIISLVSMTAPRTFRPHRVSSSPAFIEFDMTESGYGCLFLPSLATVKGVTADSISTGGIGGECRGFPPTAGLSFSCWFQISRFSSACDSHPIRLLTVVRHMSRTEQPYICLSISFSACDGCLVISTEEEAFSYLDMMDPEVSTPTSLSASLRLRCSSMLVPGQWHHLAVVMTKDVKKSCLTSAYFNGKAIGAGKMKYIQPFPGQCVSMDPTAVIDVYGLIGTPALWKEHAALVWRVGPCYFFEEALSSEAVGVVYAQGTSYMGNFQALRNTGELQNLGLVPEERISFGINPAVSSFTTVVQIREEYNEVDSRLIAKEMEITSRDNCTPIFLAQNISHHLNGTARTIGAALIGHFGIRTFIPKSASNGFLYVGGPAVVLSLIAMAPDDSALYAAVKVLLSVLETNSAMQQEMNRINGYKLLVFLLKMKSSLVSHRTLQLALCLSSSVEMSFDSCCLQNTPAFQALLCDLEVWKNTSDNLDLSVLNHFAEILKSSSDSRNAVVMHSVGLLPKLLFELSEPAVTIQKVNIISCVITSLLKAYLNPVDISSSFYVQKAVFESLGSDWFLLFLQAHLHCSTLKLGLVLLTQFLLRPKQQSSFREGVIPGTLVKSIEEPFAVIDNLRAHSWSQECLSMSCPGFDVLQELLIKHTHLPEVYEALAALLLGKKASQTAEGKVSYFLLQLFIPPLHLLYHDIFLFIVLKPFSSAKHISGPDVSWDSQLPASVMQFLCLLHNLRPRDPLWASPMFLHSLAGVVFPAEVSEVCVLCWLYKSLLQLLACINQRPEGQTGTLIGNVMLFSKTLLLKLYNGSFTGDSKMLLEFFADQIMVVRKKTCIFS